MIKGKFAFILTLCLAMISASLSFAACPNVQLGDYDFIVRSAVHNTATVTSDRYVNEAPPTLSISSAVIKWPVSKGGNGHYYIAVLRREGITWDEASIAAAAVGGYLATITSQSENDFVHSLISGKPAFWYIDDQGNGEGPWIGGYQPSCSPEPSCGWRWVTEEPFAYSNWGIYEPSNWDGDESVICFFGHQTPEGGPYWNDAKHSSQHRGYIVEFDNISDITPSNAPSLLNARATSSTSIVLTWKDNSDNEEGFKVQRKEGGCDSSNTWSQIVTKGANTTTHTNTGLTPNNTYSYRVRAYNAVGNSAYSNCASAKTALSGTPKAPTNLSATSISASKIKLIWTDNSTDEKNFKIYRKAGSGSWSLLATKGANIVSHRDDNAPGNTTSTTYSYYIQACNSSGCSPKTNIAVVPYKPTNLSATAVSSSRINLKWTDKSNNETGFQIYRKSGTCSSTNSWSRIATTGTNSTSYGNTGLTSGKTYSYKVRAYKKSSAMPYAYGYSSYSNCSSATTTSIDCVNIAGTWDFSDSGTITCTADGSSDTVPISGTGTVTIKQNGCDISWTVSGNAGVNETRKGTVNGNSLEVSGKFCVPSVNGVTFIKNQYTATGIISADEINGKGSGACAGSYQGINFSCTGKDTFVITLSGLATLGDNKAFGKTSPLFMNNSLKIFPALSP